jgi:carbamoylphosphate synthase small subunit
MSRKAVLALADGTVFEGRPFGAEGEAIGEVVFNTGMTGYQEVLSDPPYRGQIVCMTYPHIGNTGVNPEDLEAVRPALTQTRMFRHSILAWDIARTRACRAGLTMICRF